MLSPREAQQPSLWHRLKTPAVVSLACLAATLLIAAQAFRSHPHGLAKPATAAEAQAQAQANSAALGSSFDSLAGSSLEASTAFGSGGSSGSGGQSVLDSLPPVSAIAVPEHTAADAWRAAGEARAGSAEAWGQTLAEGRLRPQQEQPAQAQGNATAFRQVIQGTEVVIVNDTSAGADPKGVLLLFHGCGHSAGDWWHASPGCPACTGLPEEVAVVRAALRHSLTAVAFSSRDRDLHRCWDAGPPLEQSRDVAAVAAAWEELSAREGWARLPHYALGGSSGGAFVLLLAQRVPLDGVAALIMAVPPSLLEAKPRAGDSSKSWALPPTAFVHMQRDELTAEGVAADVAALRKQGVAVLEIAVKPRPLTPLFFAERIEGLDNATSAALFAALQADGCLNATGHLTENPRSLSMVRRWQAAIRERVPAAVGMNLNKDESPIFEELNLAWASHELVSDHTDQLLEWFEARRDGPKLLTAVNPRR